MRVLPGKVGSQPVPSVAWCGGDPGCEAYTGSAYRPRESASKWVLIAGADAVLTAEGNIGASLRQTSRSRRGQGAGHVRKGPPGTWEISSSPMRVRAVDPVNKARPASVGAYARRRDER